MLDLGFLRPIMTWYNLRERSNHITERMDRLSNLDWINIFPNARVRHLPRNHSDYRLFS